MVTVRDEHKELIRRLVVTFGECAGGEIHTNHLLPASHAAIEVFDEYLDQLKAENERLKGLLEEATRLIALQDEGWAVDAQAFLEKVKSLWTRGEGRR